MREKERERAVSVSVCLCMSLGLAPFSLCTSEQINKCTFRQQVEGIFCLGVLLQNYAERKKSKGQVSNEQHSCCFECILNSHWSNGIFN